MYSDIIFSSNDYDMVIPTKQIKNSFILAKVATKYKEKCNLLMPKGVQAGLRAPQLIYRGLINHIVH